MSKPIWLDDKDKEKKALISKWLCLVEVSKNVTLGKETRRVDDKMCSLGAYGWLHWSTNLWGLRDTFPLTALQGRVLGDEQANVPTAFPQGTWCHSLWLLLPLLSSLLTSSEHIQDQVGESNSQGCGLHKQWKSQTSLLNLRTKSQIFRTVEIRHIFYAQFPQIS